MAGELVKIGAKSGALAAWGIILRALAGKKLPIKIIEQILSEILSDIVGDLLKGGEGGEVTEYEDIPDTATLYEDHGVVTLPAEAIGVRCEVFPIASDGKYFGRNGVPDYYGLNRFESCPGGYIWRYGDFNANSRFERFDSPGQLCIPPISIKPKAFLVYPNPGVKVAVIQVRAKS
jgi:hypothetical protein